MIEFRKYIVILLIIGVDSKPEIEMHWQKHGTLTSRLIQKTISRDKFKSIGYFLDLGEKTRTILSQELEQYLILSRKLQLEYTSQ